jgi:acyl-CoA thioesterase
VTTRFDRDTALTRVDDTTFEGHIAPAWWVYRGPNGGYLAAILLRALVEVTADPERAPRSLTVHYLEAPLEGPVQVTAAVERRGRSLATVTGRMTQDGRLIAIAVGAVSRARPGPAYADAVMPEVPPPDACGEVVRPGEAPPIVAQVETRWAIGAQPLSAPDAPAHVGGWIRLAEPRPVDALLATAMMDFWLPSMFNRIAGVASVPTVDLTVHLRAALPLADAHDDDWYLANFRSRLAAEGFVEEDGELWSADGRLLAQSRQLALMLPPRR